jgi:hypothetical protein
VPPRKAPAEVIVMKSDWLFATHGQSPEVMTHTEATPFAADGTVKEIGEMT